MIRKDEKSDEIHLEKCTCSYKRCRTDLSPDRSVKGPMKYGRLRSQRDMGMR